VTTQARPQELPVQELERVTIRFVGDSGDGMQLTGTQFTRTAAVFGNDISTFPDYPAEIRAPAGSLAGVSGFQISFSSSQIHTPGDQPDVLVAMNPAALKANIGELPAGGALIVNTDAFTPANLAKVGYETNPLTDGSLKKFAVFEIPVGTLNARALEGLEMTNKQVDLTKNFFALGVMFWLYERSMEPTVRWIEDKFKARPEVAEANRRAASAAWNGPWVRAYRATIPSKASATGPRKACGRPAGSETPRASRKRPESSAATKRVSPATLTSTARFSRVSASIQADAA